MSRLQQSNGDDYPEAAGKHLTDASVLMAGDRHDGAAYLAGYVVECALKALMQVETGLIRRSHDLQALNSTLDIVAAQAGPRTQRIYVSATATLSGSDILTWKPEMRYQAEHVTAATARTRLQEAAAIYSTIIGGLRIDGTI